MSKSKGNVVDPDDLIQQYGADTVRLFALFAAPPERDLEWNPQGVEGCFRFLNRVFRLIHLNLDCFSADNAGTVDLGQLSPQDRQLHRKTHQTIRRVTDSIEKDFHFNTAISAVMELVNQISAAAGEEAAQPADRRVLRQAFEALLHLLFPMIPHFCEEIWQIVGHGQTLQERGWPDFDPAAAAEDELTIVVQINGKLRARLTVPAGAGEEEQKTLALADERVSSFTVGKAVQKIIVVKDKLVNIVVK